MKLVILLTTFILSSCLPAPDEPFTQAESIRFLYFDQAPLSSWRALPITNVRQVLSSPNANKFFLLTPNEIFLFDIDTLQLLNLQISVSLGTQIASSRNNLIVATPKSYMICSPWNDPKCTTNQASFGQVNALVQSSDGDIWVGSVSGLYQVQASSNKHQLLINQTVNAIAYNPEDESIIVGTNDRVWRKISNLGSTNWYYFWNFNRNGQADKLPVNAAIFDLEGSVWIGNDEAIDVQYPNFTLEHIGKLEGLPVPNITAMSVSPFGNIWVGTAWGAMQYRVKTKDWKYFYGSRWLPVNNANGYQIVNSIATSTNKETETALLATTTGLALIKYNTWTLAQKERHYQLLMYPRHDMFGLSGDCALKRFGDLSSYQKIPNDSNDVWTGIYLASQCFKYAVTKDPVTLRNVWNTFSGLQFLWKVTGIKGYPARSYLKQDTLPSNNWHHSPTSPGWIFEGNSSSDQITGLFFGLSVMMQTVAQSPEERISILSLISDTISHIVDNSYYLVGFNNTRTRWGVWAPEVINNDPLWYDERGVNSNQILSWLLWGNKQTQNNTFMASFWDLNHNHGYNLNLINLKIIEPDDINYSDDQLTYLPYYVYIASDNYLLKEYFDRSIQRTWKYTKRVQSSLWNTIYGVWNRVVNGKPHQPNGEEMELSNALKCLKQWPLELINWPFNNTQRLDMSTTINRDLGYDSVNHFPWDEIGTYRWNSDPFALAGGNGYTEADPGAWLVSYWMMKYYNII